MNSRAFFIKDLIGKNKITAPPIKIKIVRESERVK